MCEKQEKVKLPDLILAAVCELQEKNGVDACEIAQFVAKKRGCKLSQIEEMIKIILCKAKNYGILSEKKGLYRIEEKYDDLPGAETEKKEKQNGGINISDDSEEDENEDQGPDPCACLKFSRDCLDDDEEDENRCPGLRKKRKCG